MQYIFNFAQSDLSLQLLAGLLVILIVMITTTHWPKIKPLLDVKYALPVVFIAFSPLAILATYEIFKIVLAGVDNFGDDKRGYTILLAALAGAPFVIWRTWIAQKQGVVAEQGHMTDRISKAVEQLGAEKILSRVYDRAKEKGRNNGSKLDGNQYYTTNKTVPNLEVRLGAIYALERISQDSKRDHISVMEILCAYVRNNAPDTKAVIIKIDTKDDGWADKMHDDIDAIKTAPIDIQVALSVIGRRKPEHIKFERDAAKNPTKRAYELDLRKTNLQKLDLSKVNLDNALLNGAQLQGADLFQAELRNANLKVAQMQLADLSWVQLQEANLSTAQLQSANLEGAQLQEANLGAAQLQEANLTGAQLQEAILSRAQLRGANFIDAETRLAMVNSTALLDIMGLTENQIKSMFGDSSTTLPEGMDLPDWASQKLNVLELITKWQAAKTAANL